MRTISEETARLCLELLAAVQLSPADAKGRDMFARCVAAIQELTKEEPDASGVSGG